MERYEMDALIRQVIREELALVLMGEVGTINAKDEVALEQRLTGETGLTGLRLLRQYGFHSKPKKGMKSIILPMANDPTHLNVLTEQDEDRPDIDQGEGILYGPDGQVVFMANGGNIHIGGKGADEPAVLGNVLKQLLSDMLTQLSTQAQQLATLATQLNTQSVTLTSQAADLAAHTHLIVLPVPSTPTGPPVTAVAYAAFAAAFTAGGATFIVDNAQFTADKLQFDLLKTHPVTDGDVLSDFIFVQKTKPLGL